MDVRSQTSDVDREPLTGVADNELMLRNLLIAGGFVFLIILLYLRGLRHKRKASELRALAAEAEALSLRAKAEQVEKKAQYQFARRLIDSQEEERKRIAADLHDSLSQKLIIIRNRALLSLREEDLKEKTRDQFKLISDAAAATLEEMRLISRDLRPVLLDRFGLSETIRGTMEQVEETSKTKWSVDVDEIDSRFDSGEDINLYRIIQEAVNNILKHANAEEASLTIKKNRSDVTIIARDNGRGFEAPTVMDESYEGFGLRSIRERAIILGGSVSIESEPGKGSHVTIVIPVR